MPKLMFSKVESLSGKQEPNWEGHFPVRRPRKALSWPVSTPSKRRLNVV